MIKRRVNGMWLTWVFSYLLIMLIPIGIGFFAYYEAISAISSETEALHKAASRQLRQLLDENLNEISRAGNEIASYSSIQNYARYTYPLAPSQEYVKKDIQVYMNKVYAYSGFLSGIYVYFAGSNLFVGAEAVYREDEFEYMANTFFGLSYAKLKRFIEKTAYRAYKIVAPPYTEPYTRSYTQAYTNNETPGKILALRKVFSENYSSDAAVLFLVNSPKIAGIMEGALRHQREQVFIVDDEGGVFSPNPAFTLPAALTYERLLTRPELFRETLEGEAAIILQNPSLVNSWRCVMVIPEKIFLTKVEYIKTVIYFYILFCLILGISLSLYFAKKNYQPVKKLLNIKRLTEEKLRRQDQELRRSHIAALLTGEKGADPKSPAPAELEFGCPDFVVVLFKLKNTGSRMIPPGTGSREEAAALSRFVISQTAEELLGEKYDCRTADVDNAPCCLLNGSFSHPGEASGKNSIDEIRELLEKQRRFVFDHFGISIAAAISSARSGTRGISKAYREAVELMEYHYLTGGPGDIIDYTILPQGAWDNREMLRSLYKDKQLVDYIINEDYEGAYYFLCDIIEREFKEKKPLLRAAIFRVTGLAYSIISALGSARTALEPDLLNETGPIAMIAESNSVEDLKKNARRIFDAIAACKQRGVKKQSALRIREIEDYLLTHYHDPNLSVAALCEKFAISPSYFSRIFKRHTGLNLPGYLHKLRLTKAKELLLNTSMGINDIARETGFYNSRTFCRIFLQREGLSAGRYREQNRQGQGQGQVIEG